MFLKYIVFITREKGNFFVLMEKSTKIQKIAQHRKISGIILFDRHNSGNCWIILKIILHSKYYSRMTHYLENYGVIKAK